MKCIKELYRYIRKTKGKVFIKYEDALLHKLAKNISCISYGSNLNADSIGQIKAINPYLQISWQSSKGLKLMNTQFFNTFHFDNIMAAISIGNFFNVDPDDITSAVGNYIPKNNRSQIQNTSDNLVILDAYNANPSSMEFSLKDFSKSKFENKVVIIGDMLELGNESIKEHQNIADLLKEMQFDMVFLVGPIFCSEKIQTLYQRFDSLRSIKDWITNQPIKNCSVLLKASRKIELEKLVEVL